MTMIGGRRLSIGTTSRRGRNKSPDRENLLSSSSRGTSRLSGTKGKVVRTRSVTPKMNRPWRCRTIEDVPVADSPNMRPPLRKMSVDDGLAHSKCVAPPVKANKSMPEPETGSKRKRGQAEGITNKGSEESKNGHNKENNKPNDGGNQKRNHKDSKRNKRSDVKTKDPTVADGELSASSSSTSPMRSDMPPIVDRVPSEDDDAPVSCSQHAYPFHRACGLKPKPELLLELLQLHPSMARKRDDENNLPIHTLVTDCGSAFLPVLKELIRRYPQSVNKKDGQGQLPIHRVCRSKKKMSIDVVKVLIEASPSSLTKRVDGLLPLHILCFNARSEPRVVELVANEAPMAVAAATTGEEEGRFPLHIACSVKSRHMSVMVAILMSIAPEVAAIPCSRGEYPLHVASAAGNTATVAAILQLYPEAARICDNQGSLPVNVAYLRWHFSSLTGDEVADTIDPLMVLLEAYPEGLYHACPNGERIIDAASKKTQAKLEMLLGAAYPVTSPPSIRVQDALPKDLDAASLHMIPPKVVQALKRIHPTIVDVVHDGDAYVIG